MNVPICWRSNAIVAPSGSCSSSTAASAVDATMSSKLRVSAAIRSRVRARSARIRAAGSASGRGLLVVRMLLSDGATDVVHVQRPHLADQVLQGLGRQDARL